MTLVFIGISVFTFARESQTEVQSFWKDTFTDPELPVYDVRTLNDHIEANLIFRRIPARMFAVSNAITISEAAAMHGKWMRERPEDYSMYVRARIEPAIGH